MKLKKICTIPWPTGRSRKGAWIEIVAVDNNKVGFCVAPARERGLKFGDFFQFQITAEGRSRKGAWIEIHEVISFRKLIPVAPARERGLKYTRSSAH